MRVSSAEDMGTIEWRMKEYERLKAEKLKEAGPLTRTLAQIGSGISYVFGGGWLKKAPTNSEKANDVPPATPQFHDFSDPGG